MPAPKIIQQLVENFATHIDHYKSSGYKETEVRREYRNQNIFSKTPASH
jgi:hypothetical protein